MTPYTRREFLGTLAAGAATITCGGAAAAEGAKRPPNIVYFIIDELGYYELSCMGHPEFRTRNVDRLAAEGLRFTQGLAGSAVCAPTRCCLQTGKHSGHTSVRDNGGYTPLREGEETLGSVLKRAGYATGGFGKWGCGARGTSGVPEKHGYDVFFGYYDQVHAHTFFPRYLVRNSQEVALEGNTGDFHEGKIFSQYLIHDEAKKFIRENKDRPFFAYLCYTPPHGQWGMPEGDLSWQLYKDKPWEHGATRQDSRMYAAMVNLIDREVGEVLLLLKDLGLEDNTMVLFTGDNGGNEYFKSPEHPRGFFAPNVDPKTGAQFRGGKGNLYEGGLRLPWIARWPGRIAPATRTDQLCYFPDLMPTFAEIAGAKAPADTDGLSIAPTLFGEKAAGRKQEQHKYLYWELGNWTAVRMSNWKAVRPKPKAPWELYDLDKDIEEEEDAAAKRPDVLKQMQACAQEAHVPFETGEIYDEALVDKDRTLKLGEPPRMPRKKAAKKPVAS
jgi:arylsulfatase A-like enzyme